jgi:TfoX/Sxy family transcriptional regulator of competence genes
MPRAVRRPARAARPSRLRPLTVSAAFKSFVLDQLEELGDVTPRSMFGGVGLYHRGVFFGILARDTLYLKVGDSNRADYGKAGMKAFKPYPDRSGTMKYYAVPLEILESPTDLAVWAAKAIAVASGHG